MSVDYAKSILTGSNGWTSRVSSRDNGPVVRVKTTEKTVERVKQTTGVTVDPNFPLANRMDLPERERGISHASLESLDRSIAEFHAGVRPVVIDPARWRDVPDDDE